MKKILIGVIVVLCIFPFGHTMGQSFSNMWKQVQQAESDDLPQTQIKVLKEIIKKAEKEKAYGHLLKASLMQSRLQTTISPDSLRPSVERLKARASETKDVPLQSVFYAVLGNIFNDNSSKFENSKAISADYYKKAMAQSALLASVKVDNYEPFVMKGEDSWFFDNDLLSLIGCETKQYRPMLDYYLTTSNRCAQLLSALWVLQMDEPEEKSKLSESLYIKSLDSLTNVYGDLEECGEVAIARYEFMDEMTDATSLQKVTYIDEALRRWGSWQRMNWLRNARRDLTAYQFTASLQNKLMIPHSPQTLLLENLRGVNQLSIRFYKVNGNGELDLDPNEKDEYKKLKPLLTSLPELTISRTYKGFREDELFNDTLQLDGLPIGVYMMEVESMPQTTVSRALFFVSDVRLLIQTLPQKRVRYVVVNATTGKPLSGATLKIKDYNSKKQTFVKLTTNSQGECVYLTKNGSSYEVFASTATDAFFPPLRNNSYYGYSGKLQDREHVSVYTDRAIYRSGQPVYTSAILYSVKNGFEHEVLSGKQVDVVLRDANYKVVEEKQLTTDDYGTVSTQFTLPSTALSGRFSIMVDGQSEFFRVEEYKRPTFQVEFPKVEQDYKDGDTLTVSATARTYAGVPVQGAHVKYKVERRLSYWWLNYNRYWQDLYVDYGKQSEVVWSGEAVTSEDGKFEVQMPMVLPKTRYPLFCNFVVVADVTDQGGESHQGQLSLPLGNRKTALTVDLPKQLLAEQMPSVKFHVLNMAGNDVSASVRYQIERMSQSSEKGKVVAKWTDVLSNTSFALPKLKSGAYKLTAEYETDTLQHTFVVFSLDDKRPASETQDFFYVSATQFPNDGIPVSLLVGSSSDVHIVYTIVAGDTIIEQGSVDKSGELVNRKFTYKPEYGNGLTLSYAWFHDGHAYRHEARIQRPLPDKKLNLKWETFRDRLIPGQQEEWILNITAPSASEKDNNRVPAPAQLMATLYDKSLDQIVKHQWSLNPYVWLPMASLNWYWGWVSSAVCSGYKHAGTLDTQPLRFNHFDSDCFPYYWLGGRNVRIRGNSLLASKRVVASGLTEVPGREIAYATQKAKSVDMAEYEGLSVEDADVALQGRIAGLNIIKNDETDEGTQDIQMRENLQETAFFYPQLLADSTGKVRLQFTLPESLTTWRFMGIAHTKDMMFGYLDGEAIAQKDVMIQPNVPRFIRMGDEATISARIFNLSDKELKGTAKLLLLDAESETPIYSEQKACLLGANSTNAVTFRVNSSKLEEQYSLLICKVMIVGETFSDGEQHYLPVLSNRERVTVTVPFTQTKPGTKTIDLTSVIPATASQGELTFEYTNNPAWLMIQALPSLAHPYDKCAVCQATAFYVNTLGRYLMQQNPQVKSVFEAWKRETGGETSLMSALEKNENLKDLVLAETPWVMDAKLESDQKRQLADFFNANLMNNRISSTIDKLKSLQNEDGSWSWWEGMQGSFFMTVEVSEMLVRLHQMAGTQPESMAMLNKSLSFMDKEILKMVEEMKKEEKKGRRQTFPTHKALQYLYISELHNATPSAKVREAQQYLKKLLAQSQKSLTIREKALAAIVLHSSLYIKSLKEYTVYREDMGRYYDTPRAGYSWRDYRIPTQVAVIEAIQRLTPKDTTTVDEMRRWLLQEKRSQAWDTPLNSVDAIYAFLNGNQQALKAQQKTVLKVDGRQLEMSAATVGVGYVKTSMTAKGEKEFTAEKTSTGTSWGAVYAQFFQSTKDVADQGSEITVKREILLDGKDSKELHVGDRIKVRITIQAQRDLDFVEVIDRRAACMEPVNQLSGYRNGAYCTPKDQATHYYFDVMRKGKHVSETEYYIDRTGVYETGTCVAQCAYAPEFRATTHSQTIKVIE